MARLQLRVRNRRLLELEHVGIVALYMDSLASDAAGIPVTKAEIWVEDADLHFDAPKTDK